MIDGIWDESIVVPSIISFSTHTHIYGENLTTKLVITLGYNLNKINIITYFENLTHVSNFGLIGYYLLYDLQAYYKNLQFKQIYWWYSYYQ